MPYVKPPLGGPVGRSRMRLSASSLVSWERDSQDWFLKYKMAVRSPKNPEMILGIIVEDALVGLLMESPSCKHIPDRSIWANWKNNEEYIPTDEEPKINSIGDLKKWINCKIPHAAKTVWEDGKRKWEESISKKEDREWEDIELENIENMLEGGIQLFLEELENCNKLKGGPLLQAWRKKGEPFDIPAPCWHKEPKHPIPNKVPKHMEIKINSELNYNNPFSNKGAANLKEIWEICRPWAKDPRIWQPQRLYHQEGWASGEMDLLLRWEGTAKIVDIKASDGKSKYSAGLPIQLRFYSWLIQEIKNISAIDFEVSAIEGWYLKVPFRKIVENITKEELDDEKTRLKKIWKTQQEMERKYSKCPLDGKFNLLSIELESILPKRWKGENLESICGKLKPEIPFSSILSIPDRLNVKGHISGKWGPLNNHYGEKVHGSLFTSSKEGGAKLILEESEPDAYSELSNLDDGEYVILNAMPGVWRDMVRIYVDEKSKIIPIKETELYQNKDMTRLGGISTKSDNKGLAISRSKNSGMRLDGRPWTMQSCHLWDGEAIIEVVAFGPAAGGIFSSIIPGDLVKLKGAELGWRNGLPQLRISPKSTRIEVVDKNEE